MHLIELHDGGEHVGVIVPELLCQVLEPGGVSSPKRILAATGSAFPSTVISELFPF
jgi:hypothetical protein